MQLQEVAFLVQLVGVAVEETEDGLQFWQCVMGQIHDRRLISVDHRHGSGGAF